MKKFRFLGVLVLVTLTAGCASTADAPAYPAFVVSDEIPDRFLAALPGVLAKEYAGNMRTRSVSNRIELPTGWSGTTGGSPGKALEIYVLSGDLSLADVEVSTGGYVFVPPGSLGFNLVSDGGAQVMWFISDFNTDATIQTPLILDSSLVEWQATDRIGVFTKDLRADPGSGERTWLTRYETDAQIAWQSSSQQLEGYLISGQFQDSECVDGLPYTDLYLQGGYFRRPLDAVHGGPEAVVLAESIWLLREKSVAEINYDVSCLAE